MRIYTKANEADIADAARIYEAVIAVAPAVGWLAGVYPTEDTARRAYERGELYVCKEDGAVVASAIVNKTQVDVYRGAPWTDDVPDGLVTVLHTLSVDPAAGGRGIGRGFVAFYEDLAARSGAPYLRIDTNANNARARAMYRALGYTEVAVVLCAFNGIPDVRLVLLEKRAGRA